MAGAVAVALVLAAVTPGLLPRLESYLENVTEVAERYLATEVAGDAEAGFKLLCGELRRNQTVEGYSLVLQQRAGEHGRIRRYSIIRTETGFSDEATVFFEATSDNRGSSQWKARLSHEQGRWRWCGARSLR